jgi:hypothetical protein
VSAGRRFKDEPEDTKIADKRRITGNISEFSWECGIVNKADELALCS